MSDYSKMISVLANSNQDYYCFNDEDSCGNITNYIIMVENNIMTTFEFITYQDWPADKSQMFVKIVTETVEFKNLGEYIAYRYDIEIEEKKKENLEFCELEDGS